MWHCTAGSVSTCKRCMRTCCYTHLADANAQHTFTKVQFASGWTTNRVRSKLPSHTGCATISNLTCKPSTCQKLRKNQHVAQGTCNWQFGTGECSARPVGFPTTPASLPHSSHNKLRVLQPTQVNAAPPTNKRTLCWLCWRVSAHILAAGDSGAAAGPGPGA